MSSRWDDKSRWATILYIVSHNPIHETKSAWSDGLRMESIVQIMTSVLLIDKSKRYHSLLFNTSLFLEARKSGAFLLEDFVPHLIFQYCQLGLQRAITLKLSHIFSNYYFYQSFSIRPFSIDLLAFVPNNHHHSSIRKVHILQYILRIPFSRIQRDDVSISHIRQGSVWFFFSLLVTNVVIVVFRALVLIEFPFCIGMQRNPEHEEMRRKVIRKIDWYTLPAISLLWLACYSQWSNKELDFYSLTSGRDLHPQPHLQPNVSKLTNKSCCRYILDAWPWKVDRSNIGNAKVVFTR